MVPSREGCPRADRASSEIMMEGMVRRESEGAAVQSMAKTPGMEMDRRGSGERKGYERVVRLVSVKSGAGIGCGGDRWHPISALFLFLCCTFLCVNDEQGRCSGSFCCTSLLGEETVTPQNKGDVA